VTQIHYSLSASFLTSDWPSSRSLLCRRNVRLANTACAIFSPDLSGDFTLYFERTLEIVTPIELFHTCQHIGPMIMNPLLPRLIVYKICVTFETSALPEEVRSSWKLLVLSTLMLLPVLILCRSLSSDVLAWSINGIEPFMSVLTPGASLPSFGWCHSRASNIFDHFRGFQQEKWEKILFGFHSTHSEIIFA
jgi:hypothetical protein